MPLSGGKIDETKNLNPEDLDFILVATMSPDYTTPSVASTSTREIGSS